MQVLKELTFSVLEDVSRGLSTRVPTRRLEVLKAPRRIYRLPPLPPTHLAFDESMFWIQSALVSSVSSAGQIIGRPVVVRQLDSVINRMQQFHNEEWHSDLEVNILSNLASISARFNSSDGTASVETQTG